jgi:ketosteroid isomerase-like protein
MSRIEDLALSYFEKVRAKDAEGLGAMFADDGALLGLGRSLVGPAQIAAWYAELFATASPNPQVNALAADGDLCFAEIAGRRPDGSVARVIDLFSFNAEGRIVEMAVYLGPGARD